MRDYSKVSPQFWIGKTGKALRKQGLEAQLVAIYLLTSPHSTMLGLYPLPVVYIGHETGLGIEGASKGLQGCIEAGFCMYDEEAEVVWVIEMSHYQIADKLSANDKQCKGVQKAYDEIIENPFLGKFFEKYSGPFNMQRNRMAVDKTPIEAPSKTLGSQEQEQEQAQEQDQEQAQVARAVPGVPLADLPTAVQLSIAFNAAGIKTQPADPRLIALAGQGVTTETVAAACAEAKTAKPNESIGLGYVVAILTRWAADAAKVQAGGANDRRQAGAGQGLSDKFNFAHLDRSGDQRVMDESMARHGITVPSPDEEIEL